MSIIDQWMSVNSKTMLATLTIYDGENEVKSIVPCRFVICSSCHGAGKSSAYLGAFTRSEWVELDDEFKEDYLSGRLDKPCDGCKEYPGRVIVPDIDQLSKRERRLWNKQVRDEIDYMSMCEAERRMGA